MLLNDNKIKSAKPDIRDYRLRDGGGLFLVVRTNGNKYWQLRYRYLAKEKTLSLGKYPELTLSEAREKRFENHRLLDKGKNPSATKKEEKLMAIFRDRNSFGAIAEEWVRSNENSWTPRHTRNTKSRLDTHLLPYLGKRPVSEITPLEVLGVIQKIEKSGAIYMGQRCLQICGTVWNYAIITGRATNNITIGLKQALKTHMEEHHPTLTARELPDFLKASQNLDTSDQNKICFKLLLLSALRTGELRYSKWVDIDFDKEIWHVPGENTKMKTAHEVPLSRQALELLGKLKLISGDSDYLFPAQQKRKHPTISENLINILIDRMGYKGRIVGHGFRSLFSTILNENGFNRDAIERQLAHMERNKVRAAYNRAEYMDERRKLMQWWSDYIDKQNGLDADKQTNMEKSLFESSSPFKIGVGYQAVGGAASIIRF